MISQNQLLDSWIKIRTFHFQGGWSGVKWYHLSTWMGGSGSGNTLLDRRTKTSWRWFKLIQVRCCKNKSLESWTHHWRLIWDCYDFLCFFFGGGGWATTSVSSLSAGHCEIPNPGASKSWVNNTSDLYCTCGQWVVSHEDLENLQGSKMIRDSWTHNVSDAVLEAISLRYQLACKDSFAIFTWAMQKEGSTRNWKL